MTQRLRGLLLLEISIALVLSYLVLEWSSTPERSELEFCCSGNDYWDSGEINLLISLSTISCSVLGLVFIRIAPNYLRATITRHYGLLQEQLHQRHTPKIWRQIEHVARWTAVMGLFNYLLWELLNVNTLRSLGIGIFLVGVSVKTLSPGERKNFEKAVQEDPPDLEATSRSIPDASLNADELTDLKIEKAITFNDKNRSQDKTVQRFRAADLLKPDETLESLSTEYNVPMKYVLEVLTVALDATTSPSISALSQNRRSGIARLTMLRFLKRQSIIEKALDAVQQLVQEVRRELLPGSHVELHLLTQVEREAFLLHHEATWTSATARIETISKSMVAELSANHFGDDEIEAAFMVLNSAIDEVVNSLNNLK